MYDQIQIQISMTKSGKFCGGVLNKFEIRSGIQKEQFAYVHMFQISNFEIAAIHPGGTKKVFQKTLCHA